MGEENKTNEDANQVDEEDNRRGRSTLPASIISQCVGDRIDLYPDWLLVSLVVSLC